jgi:hypothetical protein
MKQNCEEYVSSFVTHLRSALVIVIFSLLTYCPAILRDKLPLEQCIQID